MDALIKKLIHNLKIVNPNKIILLGSHARGDFDDDSDIDLVVILDIDRIPESYDKKLDLKIKVRDSIYELSRQMPIDLIVYTNGEFEQLRKQQTSFYNEIIDTGKLIYEKTG